MIAPGAVALVSSQNAPEYTTVIPHEHTYVASDILQSLNCSDNICGCHLLHSLCNDPFYKPLHPPGLRPSPYLIQAQLHLCLRKMHPNIQHNPS